ncbi:Uncharacterized conserved protein (COG2071) [Duganella sp. CF458]|uniref:DUF2071 domain-containing protein n=1 Tax=Duganella sp. CF458 TaxID=1884368 RepID=UPI0008F1E7F4|nr:DUF2071 domain-containing protein [Duganella sp. CF458]SFG61260.1 Uncharacterized conserved protein (COG2071) [Duganella sp. CF458]
MTNHYVHPAPSLPGRLLARLANSRRIAVARRAVFSRLPFLTLESDVRDVVYLTWMMDAAAAQAMVPAGVRLWQRNGLAPFSVLTYRHGHFGPALAGPARRLLPSPLQSNWRFYLEEPGKVYFVRNVMDSPLHALGTRMFSDILPTHLPARFEHGRNGDQYATSIEPGAGSAPLLEARMRVSALRHLPANLAGVFANWDEAVSFLACQHTAIIEVPGLGRMAESEISLPIPLGEVLPLEAESVHCPMAGADAGTPFCFAVPRVRFKVLSESLAAS